MRVLWILTPELREELAALYLQLPRQRRSQEIHFLQFDPGLALRIQLVDDIGETLEVRIDSTVQRELRVRNREAADMRIVIAELERTDVTLRGAAEVGESRKTNVHVCASRANRLGLRRGRLGGRWIRRSCGTSDPGYTVQSRLHRPNDRGERIERPLLSLRRRVRRLLRLGLGA